MANGDHGRSGRVSGSPEKAASNRALEFLSYHRRGFFHVAAAITAAFMAWFYMLPLLDRTPPFEVISHTISPTSVAPGETVTITYEVHRVRECNGRVDRIFVDATGLKHVADPVPSAYRNNSQRTGAETVRFARSFVIPAGMAFGPAVYAPLTTYWCNWLQQVFPVEVEIPPIQFRVIAPVK